jgi:hypothetical protein
VARFPRVKLFCLPTFMTEGKRRLELGVRGAPADVDEAFEHLRAGVAAAGWPTEPIDRA